MPISHVPYMPISKQSAIYHMPTSKQSAKWHMPISKQSAKCHMITWQTAVFNWKRVAHHFAMLAQFIFIAADHLLPPSALQLAVHFPDCIYSTTTIPVHFTIAVHFTTIPVYFSWECSSVFPWLHFCRPQLPVSPILLFHSWEEAPPNAKE